MASANDLHMFALTPMQCEGCPTMVEPGQEIQMMSASDIRLVCISCYEGQGNSNAQ
jgi:hypothetical protein